MTISELLKRASLELQPKKIVCAADRDLGWFEAEVLLAHVLKKDRTWMMAHGECRVQSAKCRVFQALLQRRRKHEPVAYIIGEKEFYGLTFFTDKRALIPRPESELLVELALQICHSRAGGNPERILDPRVKPEDDKNVVWDVGTGSGAVAIAIAKNLPKARILATDISAQALALARKNAKRHKTKNLTFLKSDLLSPSVRKWLQDDRRQITDNSKAIIVANLPYLPESDKTKLDADVVKYEPPSALFAEKHGLKIIEKIFRQLSKSHLPFSHLFLEYDPPQTKKLRALTKLLFPKMKIQIHKDLAGRDRVMEISFVNQVNRLTPSVIPAPAYARVNSGRNPAPFFRPFWAGPLPSQG